MGCWNETCLLSNLPIRYGEKIVAYVIEFQRFGKETSLDYHGTCYHNEYASPMAGGIRGTYNDYGSIENYDSNLVRVEIISEIVGIPIDELFDKIERGDTGPYGLVFMHESIHDGIIKSSFDSYDRPYFIDEEYVKSIFESMDAIRSLAKHKDTLDEIGISLDSFSKFSELSGCGISRTSNDKYYQRWKTSKNDNVIKEFVNDYNEAAAINACMGELRRFWITTTGKGSQSTNYRMHSKLNQLIQEQITNSLLGYEDTISIYYEMLGK